jgi:hypothetical protein
MGLQMQRLVDRRGTVDEGLIGCSSAEVFQHERLFQKASKDAIF